MGLRDRPGLLLATGALVARNRQKKKQEQQRQQYQAQNAQQQQIIQAQNQTLGSVKPASPRYLSVFSICYLSCSRSA